MGFERGPRAAQFQVCRGAADRNARGMRAKAGEVRQGICLHSLRHRESFPGYGSEKINPIARAFRQRDHAALPLSETPGAPFAGSLILATYPHHEFGKDEIAIRYLPPKGIAGLGRS